jgi:hypothetical protein
MRIVMTFVCSLLLLTGCVAQDPAAPAPSASAPTNLKLQSPKLDKRAFLAALTAIDAGLTVDEDQALRRAANVCLDIKQGKDPMTVAKNAQLRYTGGNVTVNAGQARLIVAAARHYFC